MAEHSPIVGGVLLFIDPLGGTSYDTAVCMTNIDSSIQNAVIDADSACGPKKMPGMQSFKVDFEGYQIQDPATGKLSGSDLKQLALNKTEFSYKISPATPVTGDEVQTGKAFIAEISDSYSYNEASTFSMSLQPVGTPTIAITV
jgi:hypothetical protein